MEVCEGETQFPLSRVNISRFKMREGSTVNHGGCRIKAILHITCCSLLLKQCSFAALRQNEQCDGAACETNRQGNKGTHASSLHGPNAEVTDTAERSGVVFGEPLCSVNALLLMKK